MGWNDLDRAAVLVAARLNRVTLWAEVLMLRVSSPSCRLNRFRIVQLRASLLPADVVKSAATRRYSIAEIVVNHGVAAHLGVGL